MPMHPSTRCFPRPGTRFPAWLLGGLLVLLLAGCSSGPKRPLFYPNAHFERVGPAQSEQDVAACMRKADNAGVGRNKDGQVGERAAKGAVLGGIGSAAWGLVRGDAGERALAGAAAGAATGAAVGGFESAEMNPTYQRFVERCLRERGYDVIGWE
jgi:hypothetical protein